MKPPWQIPSQMAFGFSHGSKTCVTEMKLGAIDGHGSWLAIIPGDQHIEKRQLSPGFERLEGKRWGKERRGKKKREGSKEGRPGKEKKRKETKSPWAPTGSQTPAGSLSRPPSCRRGHRVAGDWRRKIGHTALPRAGGCARDWPPISGVTNTTDPACPERMGESPWPGWPTVSKT